MPEKFCMSSGLDGENGTNINLLTILEIILENRLQYILLGWVRTHNIQSILINYLVQGFYTGWLLPAAIVGLAVFLYGLCTLDHNISAQEVCSEQAKK